MRPSASATPARSPRSPARSGNAKTSSRRPAKPRRGASPPRPVPSRQRRQRMIPAEATPNCAMSLSDCWRALSRLNLLPEAMALCSRAEQARLNQDWFLHGRPDQKPPRRARDGRPWTVWLVLGGRGAGKTRTGAEWVRGMALGHPDFSEPRAGRIALVGETFSDARDVMVEGPADLLAVHDRHERPTWSPALRRLEWPSTGAGAQVFSADDPDGLRGHQFEAAWADELAKWRQAEAAWDNLQFG